MDSSLEDPFPFLLLNTLAQLPISFYVITISSLIGLLILSAFVSGSEVAFFSFTHEKLAAFNSATDQKQVRVARLLKKPKRLLATILILNNLVNIFIVTISTYATWQIFGHQEEGFIIAVLTAVITITIIFFGEIIPKVYANENGESFAKFTSGLLASAFYILKPLSWFLIGISNVVERRWQKKGYNLTVEEINQALEISVEKEEVTENEKEILKGIVNFGTLSVKQVMKSRMDITAFDLDTDFHELMNQINKTGYSRIPIYSDTIDKIEGILYIKDLLPHLEMDEDFSWQGLLRSAYFVPESKKIDDLLKDFQEKQVHIAIVIDEYGGTSGLITMEDVIEEIVGEINDEFDDDSDIAYNQIDSNTYVFEGKTSLNDFGKITDVDTSVFDEVKGESESLGGLLLEINSKLPHAGEKITFERFVFTVVAVDQKRIKKLRIFIDPKNSPIKA